jgi:hypothetical protein
MNSVQYLLSAIDCAISQRAIKPLITCIEDLLQKCTINHGRCITVFSCDSFCQPHLELQLQLYTALSVASQNKTNFINLPISHYISSVPDIRVLRNARITSNLSALNNMLLEKQRDIYNRFVPLQQQINLDAAVSGELSHRYETMLREIPSEQWQSLFISGFPFHELSMRDLSLTYKVLPEHCHMPETAYYEHFITLNQFNIWLLITIILASPAIGRITCGMSFYTSTSVFRMFCKQTGRACRYFGGNNLIHLFRPNETSHLLTITRSPLSHVELTMPSTYEALESFTISESLKHKVDTMLQNRIEGYGSHTYSPQDDRSDPGINNIYAWIERLGMQGIPVLSAFTSSPDEMIGQNLGFIHEEISLSHLASPVFRTQEEWLHLLIDQIKVSKTPVGLVIRLHPRLGADKRGLGASPILESHYIKLVEKCGDSPYIRIIHPQQLVSSYRIGLKSAAILNGWSTIGLELAILGKPVNFAFYKCKLGGAAMYPVHRHLEPMRSVDDYRRHLAVIIDNVLNMEFDNDLFLTRDDAIKALIAYSACGVVDSSDPNTLLEQLVSPKMFPPFVLSNVFTND